MKLIEGGMFCKVVTSDYAEHGIKRDDIVYVGGSSYLPIDEKDPYVYRKSFAVVKFEIETGVEGHTATFLNGLNLVPVSKVKQEKYEAILKGHAGE